MKLNKRPARTMFVIPSIIALCLGSCQSAPEQKGDKVGSLANEFIQKGAKGIAVAVAINGKPVYAKGFSDGGESVNADSVFRIGSVTKQFTAGLVVRMVRSHVLALSDPLGKWIPEVPVLWRPVTLRQLLTHTSGIPSYTDNLAFYMKMNQPATPDQVWKMAVGKVDLEFPPGKGWKYSNSNYALLGCVLERATHRKYFDLLQSMFFTPLGMKNTGKERNHPSVPGFDAAGHPASPINMDWPYSAGAIVSSANDLVKWDQALRGDRLFTEAEKRQMFTPDPVGLEHGQSYGFGWLIVREGQKTVGVEHNGGINGFNSNITRSFKGGTTVIVLNDTEQNVAEPLADKILALYEPNFQSEVPAEMDDPKPEEAAKDAALLRSILDGSVQESAFASDFLSSVPFTQVKAIGSQLKPLGELQGFHFVSASGSKRLYALGLGSTRFKMEIVRDDSGKVAGLLIHK